jgi:cyclopentanol dehydrogenase
LAGRLEGRIALVTGAAKGIGKASASALAAEGAAVALADIDREGGEALAAELAEAGAETMFVALDVTSEADWQQAVDTAVERFGGLHILVNNAGIWDGGNVETQTVEGWDRTMDINAKGVFLGTKAAIPAMRESGSGSIVNISSTAGITGSAGSTAYNASKGAVRILTKSTAVQYAAEGIRCNSVHPGPIDTQMIREAFPDDDVRNARIGAIPLGRMGDMYDVAKGVLFLASDEASYMTGSELVIDGGATAM